MNATRERIKSIAIELAKEKGLINISRVEICEAAGIPVGSFTAVTGGTFSNFINELHQTQFPAPSLIKATKSRANPKLRKINLLEVAVDLAKITGYRELNCQNLAAAAGVSHGLINHYFGSIKKLRKELMRHAVRHEIKEIVAQGLAVGDERARSAPQELKNQAAAYLASV